MKIILPILFALIAAVGNAMFALGQKKSATFENSFLFVAASSCVAFLLAFLFSPIMGDFDVAGVVRKQWRAFLLSGGGLFLTYVGFNLLYSRFGVSLYILYAVISIITTTIFVGMIWLREPVNIYHIIAIIFALGAIVLFSIGQSKI